VFRKAPVRDRVDADAVVGGEVGEGHDVPVGDDLRGQSGGRVRDEVVLVGPERVPDVLQTDRPRVGDHPVIARRDLLADPQ